MKNNEILNALQCKLFHNAIENSYEVKKILAIDLQKFRYRKVRNDGKILQNILKDLNVCPIEVSTEENSFLVCVSFYKDDISEKHGSVLYYTTAQVMGFEPGFIEEKMKGRVSLENIKSVFSEIKKMFSNEILTEILHLCLLNNEEYKEYKCFTYENLFCFLELLKKLNQVPKLKKEAEKIVAFF